MASTWRRVASDLHLVTPAVRNQHTAGSACALSPDSAERGRLSIVVARRVGAWCSERMRLLRSFIPSLATSALLLSCAAHEQQVHTASPGPTATAAPLSDRSPEDRALDAQRKPEQMLAVFEVRPGMRAADLGAGGGYTTELLARAVGPSGVVFSQNPPQFLKFADKPWTARLSKPALSNVVRVDRPMDDPLPPEARGLDVVVSHAIYHDTVWMNADRERMNRAVFEALKPGGGYVVIDSSAKPGTGISDAQTLHRIDEQTVIAEVERVGFKLQRQSDAWRNPEDTRDWSASPGAAKERRGTGDRFALRFVKP